MSVENRSPTPAANKADTRQYLSTDSDWTFETLETYDREIGRIAKGYGLDTYPNQIEIISAEQMMDAYSSVGMPIGYNHWSYGKQFLSTQKSYQRGQMGLAYEIVINTRLLRPQLLFQG
jgi:stage V sporulation protein R